MLVTVQRTIRASPDAIFRAVSDIERFPEVVPEVQAVEFLTDSRGGVGTRFRETREVNGRPHTFELEVQEYDREARQVRMVCDAGGTLWDTSMSVEAHGDDSCTLRMAMDARGHRWTNRVMNRLLKGMFRRGMVEHVDALQERYEASR